MNSWIPYSRVNFIHVKDVYCNTLLRVQATWSIHHQYSIVQKNNCLIISCTFFFVEKSHLPSDIISFSSWQEMTFEEMCGEWQGTCAISNSWIIIQGSANVKKQWDGLHPTLKQLSPFPSVSVDLHWTHYRWGIDTASALQMGWLRSIFSPLKKLWLRLHSPQKKSMWLSFAEISTYFCVQ